MALGVYSLLAQFLDVLMFPEECVHNLCVCVFFVGFCINACHLAGFAIIVIIIIIMKRKDAPERCT